MVVNTDKPIRNTAEDRLGRNVLAATIKNEILAVPQGDSCVLALLGPWGSGKSSILNLLENQLCTEQRLSVIRFNPWLFSGTEQLVGQFFQELRAHLLTKNEKESDETIDLIDKYCDGLMGATSWIPQVGAAIEAGTKSVKLAGTLLRKVPPSQSVQKQRRLVEERLAQNGRRFVVMIDDVDRLTNSEVRDVMRLVKLTGDFPNMVYLLAFDRGRVELALSDNGEGGRAYLEKIFQATFHVPSVRTSELLSMVDEGVGAFLDSTSMKGPWDVYDWVGILHKIVMPLVRTPRDVRRYLNALRPAAALVRDEVAMQDLLALEAIRVFLPDVFALLPEAVPVLTHVGSPDLETRWEKETRKDIVRRMEEAAGTNGHVLDAITERVFPAAEGKFGPPPLGVKDPSYNPTWRKGRRVAHPAVLRLYLEKSLPAHVLEGRVVQALFDGMALGAPFGAQLDTLSELELVDAMARLEDFEAEFDEQKAQGALAILLDHRKRLSRQPASFFGTSPRTQLDRVVLRLLRKVPDARRVGLVKDAFAKTRLFSGKEELLGLVGDKCGAAIPAADLSGLETELRREMLRATPALLMEDDEIFGVLLRALADSEGQRQIQTWSSQDDTFFAVLRSSQAASRVLPSDGVVRESLFLPWESLCTLFGKDWLERRLQELNANGLSRADAELRLLALRYASGELIEPRLGGEGVPPAE